MYYTTNNWTIKVELDKLDMPCLPGRQAMLIKNFHELATTPERKIVLKLVEAGLESVQPEEVFKKNIHRNHDTLTIVDRDFDLDDFDRVFILGFGKGSAGNARLLEKLIKDKLTEGYVIDTEEEPFSKIEFTKGTHPLPSEENYKFTQKVIEKMSHMTFRDLVLVVICGGGSAMLVHPHSISLAQKINVGKALLKSGADIGEMNIVRKHLSDIKGGGLAKILYPATIATLVFSDVPGNDLSTIASGPTVRDKTTIDDALHVIKKYKIEKEIDLTQGSFVEKPHENKYFEKVHNIIVLSNQTALSAMLGEAKKLGLPAKIFSDRFQADAKQAGKKLISPAHPNSILLAAGETTVHVAKKAGQGGRNQTLVLASLEKVGKDVTICSFGSDGFDNTEFAGAIGDYKTVEDASGLGLDIKKFLNSDNSFEFFQKTKDGIATGRLPSNVSDLMIVLRK